jgi:hypothetical protein
MKPLIIHDARMPEKAIAALENYGELLPFITDGITCEAIAGHPDIFFCQIDNKLIVAPNVPEPYICKISELCSCEIIKGVMPAGCKKEDSTCYNAVITDEWIIHHRSYCDPVILRYKRNREFLQVPQPYTRCSLLPLKNNRFVTSDRGIEKVLRGKGLDCLYVDPRQILLPGFPYGFFGGCAGIYGNKILLSGSLQSHPQGDQIAGYLNASGYEIVELCADRLFDAGTIFSLEQLSDACKN